MINAPADFPQAGSYGLVMVDGRLAAARIVRLIGEGEAREADISLLGIPAASGRRRVPLSQIVDGTPLSPAEQCEFSGLQMRRRLGRANRARFEALSSRVTHAPVLAARLDLDRRRLEEARDRDQRREAGFIGRFGKLQARYAAARAEASVQS